MTRFSLNVLVMRFVFYSSGRWWRQKQWRNLLQFLHWTSMGWFWKRLHLWRGREESIIEYNCPVKHDVLSHTTVHYFPSLGWRMSIIQFDCYWAAPVALKKHSWDFCINEMKGRSELCFCSPLSQLLNRVFNIMREKNPDMVAGEKRKFVMKPPQVVRVGTKKTSFVNFTDICKLWV